MNVVKMSVATVLALVHLVLAIPLAFSILILFVLFGLPVYYLVNKISPKSKAYKVYKSIISPLDDCYVKILDLISY